MNKRISVLILTLVLMASLIVLPSNNVYAAGPLKIDEIFSDDMVLQRNKKICVYGSGSGTGTVTIGNVTKEVKSTGDAWKIYFDPMSASTQPVTFTYNLGGRQGSFSNVLIGDVYVASGQSNMEYTLQKTEQKDSAAKDSNILRFSKGGDWTCFSKESVQSMTAIGVLFAQELEEKLSGKVPVGIISASKGASRIDDWTSEEYCVCDKYCANPHSDYTYYDQGHHDLYKKYIEPITKFPVAGVLWYQGESNRGIGEAKYYYQMFENMLNCWRTAWNDPELPFYTVQIMLYSSNTAKDKNGNAVDEYNIRIAQGEAARTLKNVTMCSMLSHEDTWLPNGNMSIHPTDKLPVAKALANAALTEYYNPLGDYSQKPEYCGPLYKDVTVSKGKAEISFTHIGGGLVKLIKEAEIGEFEIMISGGDWVDAKAEIAGDKVVVTAENVSKILGVRMAYKNSPLINVYNGAGYCASPFIWTDETAINRHEAVEHWSSKGDVHYKKCNVVGCDEIYDEAKHSGAAVKSCKDRATCEICGYSYLGGENHGETELRYNVEPTETEVGYTGSLFCKDCGKRLTESEEIPTLAQQRKEKTAKLLTVGGICLGALIVMGVVVVLIVVLKKKKRESVQEETANSEE